MTETNVPSVSRKCSYRLPDGRPCRAWAVRGSDPPGCSAHLGLNIGAGAPKGNKNRLVHGWYSPVFSSDEIVDLVNLASDTTLDDEIAAVRVALRRVFTKIQGNKLSPEQYTQLVRLLFSGANTVPRLLRVKKVISGEAADGISGSFALVLDELDDVYDAHI